MLILPPSFTLPCLQLMCLSNMPRDHPDSLSGSARVRAMIHCCLNPERIKKGEDKKPGRPQKKANRKDGITGILTD